MQDIVPPTERGQDPTRSTENLVAGSARPLSDEERKAADKDAPVAEPVYAPASERVPKTVSSYGDVVSRTDPATPERQATPPGAATSPTTGSTAGPQWGSTPPPSFTGVPRAPEEIPSSVTSEAAWDTSSSSWLSGASSSRVLPIGGGWLALMAGGVGVWLFLRWRRERNKPINRFRRQARQAAGQARERASALRDQMPDLPEFPDEARRPAIGLGTALLPLALLVWQRMQSRSRAEEASRQARKKGKLAAQAVSDSEWLSRLQQLKDLWTARRVEVEKVKITRK